MATKIGAPIASDLIKPHAHEAVKQYIEYDGFNRMSAVYVASAYAEDGDAAMKTEYVYVADSSRVVKMKESLTTWDSAWDI